LLHYIFQRTGVTPDVVMSKPRFVRTFMLCSMEVQIEAEAEQAAAARERQRQAQAARASRRR
jgi:hypothetical protein